MDQNNFTYVHTSKHGKLFMLIFMGMYFTLQWNLLGSNVETSSTKFYNIHLPSDCMFTINGNTYINFLYIGKQLLSSLVITGKNTHINQHLLGLSFTLVKLHGLFMG